MPQTAIFKAVENFFNGLTLANKPQELWFDGVDLRGATGDPTTIPSANMIDGGTTEYYDFEHIPFEETTVTLEFRAETLEVANQIAVSVQYNGQAPTSNAGLAFCQSLVVSYGTVLECKWVGPGGYSREQVPGVTANVVHRVQHVYKITVLRRTG